MFVYVLVSSLLVFICCYCFAINHIDSSECDDDEDDFALNGSMIDNAFTFDRAGDAQLFEIGERIVEMFD